MPPVLNGLYVTVRKASRVLPQRDCGPTSKPPIYKGLGSANPYIADPHFYSFLRTVVRVRKPSQNGPEIEGPQTPLCGPKTRMDKGLARWSAISLGEYAREMWAESAFEALVLKALRFIRDARKYAGDREYGHLAKRGLMPRGIPRSKSTRRSLAHWRSVRATVFRPVRPPSARPLNPSRCPIDRTGFACTYIRPANEHPPAVRSMGQPHRPADQE